MSRKQNELRVVKMACGVEGWGGHRNETLSHQIRKFVLEQEKRQLEKESRVQF